MVDFQFRKLDSDKKKKNPKQKTQSLQRVLGYFKTMCGELGVSYSAVIGFCMVGKSQGELGQDVGLVLQNPGGLRSSLGSLPHCPVTAGWW